VSVTVLLHGNELGRSSLWPRRLFSQKKIDNKFEYTGLTKHKSGTEISIQPSAAPPKILATKLRTGKP
jgi:hypothetical protein